MKRDDCTGTRRNDEECGNASGDTPGNRADGDDDARRNEALSNNGIHGYGLFAAKR
jgi:hypothetical protein